MRKRYLTVIKNERGLEEDDCGVEESENIKVYELPENEFEELCKTGVFEKINNDCSLMMKCYPKCSVEIGKSNGKR